MNQHSFLLYGRSGSGKGTQAELLIKHLEETTESNVVYIETGRAIREFVKSEGHVNSLVKDVIENGGLLPAFIPIFLWTTLLNKNFTGKEHLVLDGLARRSSESPVLANALDFLGFKKRTVIIIDVSHDWAVEKLLSRGRADDNEADIRRRLEWYDSNVEEAIRYFRSDEGFEFLTVNGEQSIEEVHQEILEKTGI